MLDPVVAPSDATVTRSNKPPESPGGTLGIDLRFALRMIKSYFRADALFFILLVIGFIALSSGGSYFLLNSQEQLASVTNALAAKDGSPIPGLLATTVAMVGVWLLTSLASQACVFTLRMRARTHYTGQFLDRWLARNRFYHIQHDDRIDHPEQRIQEDIFIFIEKLISLGPGMIAGMAPLFIYGGKLWSLSPVISLAGLGLPLSIPGSFFFLTVIYAFVWTWVTHLMGRSLTRTEVVRQRLEARFRHEMAALRENSEAIAFERGAANEARILNGTFDLIRTNWVAYVIARLKISFCVSVPAVTFQALTFALCAPLVLDGRMKLGDVQLVTMAFQIVFMSFGVFIQGYDEIAIFRSATARLRVLEEAIEKPRHGGIRTDAASHDAIKIEKLKIDYPDGSLMADIGDLEIRRGDRVMIKGRSGVGKSTLLRAIAGLWGHGEGRVSNPDGARISFLPQQAYMPQATLAALMAYPLPPETISDATLHALLDEFGLSRLKPRLHDYENWRQMLSPGERQRIAAARAILNKPDFLFLDEATSALDSHSEANLYALLGQHLPGAAIISVAHREAVEEFHDSSLEIADGRVRGSATQPGK